MARAHLLHAKSCISASPSSSDGEASAWNARDQGSVPGWGRFPGEGNGSPLQYSCLENPMGRGAWWVTVHGVAVSRTPLSNETHKSCVYAYRVPLVQSDSLRPCRLWPARLPCQRGGSPGKNTGGYWPILVAIPFLSTIFPTTLDANPPEYLVLPEPL